MRHCLIMAGGRGTRFWPLSRTKTPKQLLALASEDPLIVDTIKRIPKKINKKNIQIFTNKEQVGKTRKVISKHGVKNIISEPIGRNTAPCIALSCMIALEKDPEASILVLPADHLIQNTKKFQEDIEKAFQTVEKNNSIVVFGIRPTSPHTGYGYIQVNKKDLRKKIASVSKFVEKPNLELAKKYLKNKNYYWNSGMFVFKASAMLEAMEEHLPELYDKVTKISPKIGKKDQQTAINRIFKSLPSISIDYGIIEKYSKVDVVRSSFDWNDLGSWSEAYENADKDKKKNALKGNIVSIDSNGNYVSSQKQLVGLVGVENLVVVSTEDSLLILDRKKTQDIKKLIADFEKNPKKFKKYL